MHPDPRPSGRRPSGSRQHRVPTGRALPVRLTDRVESFAAWLLCTVGLFGFIGALLIGAQVHSDVMSRVRTESAQRVQVTATLVRAAALVPDPEGRGTAVPTLTPVRWTTADGREHTGQTSVVGPIGAGARVAVWTDRHNQLVPAPVTPIDALLSAGAYAAVILALLGVALRAAWWGIARWMLAWNCARWEREWALVEPPWSGRPA